MSGLDHEIGRAASIQSSGAPHPPLMLRGTSSDIEWRLVAYFVEILDVGLRFRRLRSQIAGLGNGFPVIEELDLSPDAALCGYRYRFRCRKHQSLRHSS